MRPGHRRRLPSQAELFETPSDRPRWEDFPFHVRSLVIQELARLLESARRQQPRGESQEVGYE